MAIARNTIAALPAALALALVSYVPGAAAGIGGSPRPATVEQNATLDALRQGHRSAAPRHPPAAAVAPVAIQAPAEALVPPPAAAPEPALKPIVLIVSPAVCADALAFSEVYPAAGLPLDPGELSLLALAWRAANACAEGAQPR